MRAHSSPELEEEEWYGWQNLALDGCGLALFVTGMALQESATSSWDVNRWFVGAGLATFVLGSPIADWSHGNVELAIGSFALRAPAAAMAMWGWLQRAVGCESEEEDGRSCSQGVAWLAAAGVFAAVAVALDGVLDREPGSRQVASLPLGFAVRENGALLMVQGAL
ncbi:MAG TPA: hypothetical protein VK509_06805 [Polyangiales bacterium]|nr:hypothetical protein [Polyangiales bacterium]